MISPRLKVILNRYKSTSLSYEYSGALCAVPLYRNFGSGTFRKYYLQTSALFWGVKGPVKCPQNLI